MLSLLTYGATFGVAESCASTRHEIDLAQELAQLTVSPETAIDPEINSGQDSSINSETEQEQRTTKGGVVGWLKRLIERLT